MGHTGWVGRLLLGHTVRQEWWWVGRQVIMRTALVCVSRLMGSDPTRNSDSQVFEGLSGYVAFEAPHDLGGVETFFSPPCHISAGFVV